MKRPPILPLLLLLLLAPAARSQTFWTQTNGPEGGLITAVTVDSSSRVFIGTAAGGIFASSNRGDRWYARNNGLTSLHIKSIESSPAGYIFAITFDAGLFRYYRDDEAHWTHIDASDTFSSALTMVASPNGHVFVGTGGKGVLRSTDNGTTWGPVNTGFVKNEDFTVLLLSVSPTGKLIAVNHKGSLFVSNNEGASWTALPATPVASLPTSIVINRDGSFFLGNQVGNIFFTTDDGQTWKSSFHDAGGFGIYNIYESRANGHLFARNNDGVLYRSDDNGGNWRGVDSIATGGSFYPAAIDPLGVLYTGTDFEGMFRSTDDGETFQLSNGHLICNLTLDVATDKKHNVYAVTEDFVWRSNDRGDTWLRLPFEIGETFENPSFAIDSSGFVFVGAATGVYMSYDSGMHWLNPVPVPPGEGANQVFALGVSPSSVIFAGTQFGLEISRDHGQSWKIISDGVDVTSIKSVVIGKDSAVYVEDVSGNISKTTDDGYNWTSVGMAIGLNAVDAKGWFYRRDNRELLRSTDGLQSWQLLHPRDTTSAHGVFDVMVDRQNNLIASTDSGVFLSTNSGDTWSSVGAGLKDPSATRLSYVTKVCEDRDGTYYAASRGQGVFRSVPLFNDVKRDVSENRERLLGQNYPNPFTPSTTIPFTLSARSHVTLDIRDITGSLVWSTDLGDLTSGSYTVPYTSSLASGIYRYTITANGLTESRWMTILK